MRHRPAAAFLGGMLLVAACGQPPPPGETNLGTTAPPQDPTTTEGSATPIDCQDVDVLHAPEDWYSDAPTYVSNEAPIDEIREFAAGLSGFQDVWFDRKHNGWVGVGFHEADVEAHQAALEAEFPGVGVVAVDMPYTDEDLEALARQVDSRLPDGMEVTGVNEVRASFEIWVGLLTPENIAAATEAIGDLPGCISGQDPATTPAPGPQPAGGVGWTYLLEVEGMPESESPILIEDPEALASVLGKLGVTDESPVVDFEQQVVLVLIRGHSSSCPVTRLDDIVVEGDLVYAVIPTITDEMACTADAVPRTYLAAVDRDILPPEPFQIEITETPEPPPPARQATLRPLIIETTFPWPLVFDIDCGADYLGEINAVHWHRSDGGSGVPPEWKGAAVDGLVDMELMMTEGPAPTLTATAAGVEVTYLPGADPGEYCT